MGEVCGGAKMSQPTPKQRQLCSNCNGKGQVFHNTVWKFGLNPCQFCNGTGYVEYNTPPWRRK